MFRHLLRDDFDDITVTAAARVYLAAFDAYVSARADGDRGTERAADSVKTAALKRMQPDQGSVDGCQVRAAG